MGSPRSYSGDPNMTGWAEEISLDVLWAHAIAPGANVDAGSLPKTNDDCGHPQRRPSTPSITTSATWSRRASARTRAASIRPILSHEHRRLRRAPRCNGWTIFASSGDDGAAQQTCDGSTRGRRSSHRPRAIRSSPQIPNAGRVAREERQGSCLAAGQEGQLVEGRREEDRRQGGQDSRGVAGASPEP